MATTAEVKQYLAYWFQLGKRVVLPNRQTLLPQPIFQGQNYSSDFENCWRQISDPKNQDCYLEGTEQTISELLSSAWDVLPCARCAMPVPLSIAQQPSLACPCFDLDGWPNTELPKPRSAVNTQERLRQIRQNLSAN